MLNISSDLSGSAPPELGYADGDRRGSNKRFLLNTWICILEEKEKTQEQVFKKRNLNSNTRAEGYELAAFQASNQNPSLQKYVDDATIINSES